MFSSRISLFFLLLCLSSISLITAATCQPKCASDCTDTCILVDSTYCLTRCGNSAALSFQMTSPQPARDPNPTNNIKILVIGAAYRTESSPDQVVGQQLSYIDVFPVSMFSSYYAVTVVFTYERDPQAQPQTAAALFWRTLNAVSRDSPVRESATDAFPSFQLDNSTLSIADVKGITLQQCQDGTNVKLGQTCNIDQALTAGNNGSNSESSTSVKKLLPIILPIVGGVLIMVMITMIVVIRRRRDANKVLMGTEIHTEGGVTMA